MKKNLICILFGLIMALGYAKEINSYDKLFEPGKLVEIPNKNLKMLNIEVTQKIYKKVMGVNPSYFQFGNNFEGYKHENDLDYYKNENLPVESISWFDAIYFCNKLSELYGFEKVYSFNGTTDESKWNYVPNTQQYLYVENYTLGEITQNLDANGFRLPTIAEWEYAAKGGEDFLYAGSNSLDEVGWYNDNSDDETHPVAQKKPNGYGIFDMCGNVLEYTWDLLEGYVDWRTSKGGAIGNYDFACKIDFTFDEIPDIGTAVHGFRIVCSSSQD